MAETNNEETELNKEESPSTEVQKTHKELFGARMAGLFPDDDEETQYGNMLKHLDDTERVSNAHKELQQKLTDKPKAAMFLGDYMDGVHPAVAMKRYFEPDELEISEEDENYESLLQAERERVADAQQRKEMQEEYEQNLINSQESVQKFCKKKGLSEEEFEDFIESAVGLTNDLLSGNLNTELLDILWNGRNYESDITEAEERGSIKERNAKHEAKQLDLKGDGLPHIKNGSSDVSKKVDPKLQGSRYGRDVWKKGE